MPPSHPTNNGDAQSAMTPVSLRSQNVARLTATLHERGPLTRSQLGDATGLTRSTVGTLVGELEEAGLVDERPATPDGRPGRPSPVVSMASGLAVLAFEAVVDSIAVATVALDGTVLGTWRQDRTRSPISVDQTLHDFVRLTDSCRRQAGDPEILAVGVGVAGLVRHDDGNVAFAPNLGWRSVPFGRLLGEVLGLDVPIDVRNEGDLAMLAEARRGVARGVRDLLYVHAEVGIGGGMLSNGEIVSGRHGYGGEIGHFPVTRDGRLCGCGARGCWEAQIGESALLESAGLDPAGGSAEFEQLLSLAAKGEERAVAAFADAGRWLGQGIAGLGNVGNPEMVILGGMYATAFDHVIDEIRAELDQRHAFPTFDDLQIVPSRITHGAPLIGAAELAIGRVVADPLAFVTG